MPLTDISVDCVLLNPMKFESKYEFNCFPQVDCEQKPLISINYVFLSEKLFCVYVFNNRKCNKHLFLLN